MVVVVRSAFEEFLEEALYKCSLMLCYHQWPESCRVTTCGKRTESVDSASVLMSEERQCFHHDKK